MALENIENIIFDLGGVVIDINPQQSFDALGSYIKGKENGKELLDENVDIFLNLEKGLISVEEFYEGIRGITNNPSLSDVAIADAWNLMLLHIPSERLQILEKLRANYQTYVLSNTNAIHVPAFNKIVEKNSGKHGIDHFFDKVYFSHDLQMRKPEPEIYQYVIDDSQLNVGATLFIDDRLENLEAAAALGLQTYHVQPERGIVELFANA